jgi:hypothetical protein
LPNFDLLVWGLFAEREEIDVILFVAIQLLSIGELKLLRTGCMKWIRNVSLTILSIAILLFAFEIALRNFMNPMRIYGVWFVPEMNIKSFKWQSALAWSDKPNKWENFDPNLGWDTNKSGIKEPDGIQLIRQPGHLRVLFIGDSFIFGNEVGNQENIASLTSTTMIGVETINMGVAAYGIDQSYLKLLTKGLAYRPDIVIFAIHPPNYERASLTFFSAPKPRFTLDESGELKLTNHPLAVPSPHMGEELLEQLERESFLFALLKKVIFTKIIPIRERLISEFLQQMNPIILEILEKTKEAVDARLIVLQIPHGKRFHDATTRANLVWRYPLDRQLIALYKNWVYNIWIWIVNFL